MLAICERERPDALLPTLGGQTALNVAVALAESGDLDRLGIALIGASLEAIHRAEDRSGFKDAMLKAGLDVPRAGTATTLEEALALGDSIGYPLIVRASFTMGGGGSGFAANRQELASLAARSLEVSPVSEILVEESIAGWKEFELEVMRDGDDNGVIVCSIENVDPMGVHTGDSITVAPQQTLTDREYQQMRDSALQVLRVIGVETGGSNVQFAVDPATGRQVLIEMNPRVSRSSALASKATGFPIAKIAALLAVGYRLDEITNDITGETPVSFEPTLDYVVGEGAAVRVREVLRGRPAPDLDDEVRRRGHGDRTHLQGGARQGVAGHREDRVRSRRRAVRRQRRPRGAARRAVRRDRGPAAPGRSGAAGRARRRRDRVGERHRPMVRRPDGRGGRGGSALRGRPLSMLSALDLWHAKRAGLSDARIAMLTASTEATVRRHRDALGVAPVFKTVDTCAGEFPARTPYHFSTYEEETEVAPAPVRGW